MADPTYVNVTESDFRSLMDSKSFEQIFIQGTTELVFERVVVSKTITENDGRTGYKIRVYSSVAYGQTRDVGEDAIRVQLIDENTNYPVRVHGEKRGYKVGKRINRTAPNGIPESERTASLLKRVYERCEEFWVLVQKNLCPDCGIIMANRTGKFGAFKSCTSRECDHTESM